MAVAAREVRREIELDVAPEVVWEAFVDDRGLSEWLADEVELEPVEGSRARFRTGDETREGAVLRVEEGRLLAFTWSRDGELPSEVELTVDAVAGGSRVVVVERTIAGPAAAAGPPWSGRLAALAAAIALVAV